MAEVLIAAAVTAILLTVVLAAASVQLRLARSHPGAIDLTERARTLGDVMHADLVLSGAGFALEDGQSALGCCLPVINPRRLGFRDADAPGTSRTDLLTLSYLPRSAVLARLAAPVAGSVSPLVLSAAAPCPSVPLCGLADRDDVVVFDGSGNHDYFRVVVSGGAATLTARQSGPGSAYDVGAYLSRVETHTYYFDSGRGQIRHYDGYLSDVPVVDNVAGFSVDYWGEDRPPVRPKPPLGSANCLYDALGALRSWPRAIGSSSHLVSIFHTELGDGPWCGDGDNRFDADLLRIRRVRANARLQAPDVLRGTGNLFGRAGHANASLSMVPDLSIAIDVVPRSLNAGR